MGSAEDNYVDLYGFGKAFATSTWSSEHEAKNAFWVTGDDHYWSSASEPSKPVAVWFRFEQPKRVIKIKFEEQYKLPAGSIYEVFASNNYNDCGKQTTTTTLVRFEANIFAGGSEFQGSKFKVRLDRNDNSYHCYGVRAYAHDAQYKVLALKRIQLKIAAPPNKEISSQLVKLTNKMDLLQSRLNAVEGSLKGHLKARPVEFVMVTSEDGTADASSGSESESDFDPKFSPINAFGVYERPHYSTKEIRLVDGTSPSEGRIEIFYNGQWGTVCDRNYFDEREVDVVCRMLGFETGTHYKGTFGQGNGPIWLSHLNCTGNEASIFDCQSQFPIGSPAPWCDHNDDIGVSCQGFWSSRQDPEKPVRLWFQFNEPKRVTKIKFKEIFALASGYGYEVFASEALGDCGNIKKQIILAEAEPGVSPYPRTQVIKKFENWRYFPCYGIQTYHPGPSSFVGLSNVMFGIEDHQSSQLKSLHLKGKYVKSLSDLHTELPVGRDSITTIADWTIPPWSPSQGPLRANTDRDSGGINGIQVKESGIYFVYSNFPFGGEGLGCFYKLRYGDRSQTCYWKRKGENSNDATSQHQPCYLGFLTNMNKDEVLGIDLFVGETCRVSNLEFELLLDTSFLGMIKIG